MASQRLRARVVIRHRGYRLRLPRTQAPNTEIADSATAENEAPDDRRREDDEQRGRLCGVLREPDCESEEGNDQRPAADSEQDRQDARREADDRPQDAEGQDDERGNYALKSA